MRRDEIRVPVLIVGGGPVGLALAIGAEEEGSVYDHRGILTVG